MTSPRTTPALPPRVSVALCTFNGERFLGEQLASIAGQSVPVDEVVVCDDGSTDGTVAVARSFADRLPVRVSVNPVRLGVTKNFERAVGLCGGDVIFLCDQDDVWEPDKVAVLVDRLRSESETAGEGESGSSAYLRGRLGRTHSGAAMAFSNAAVVNADLSPAGYRLWDSVWFDPAEQARVRAGDAVPVLLRHAVAAGATVAFRSDYRPLLLPIPDLPHCHDIWVTLLLACVGRIDPVDRDLVRYRLHGGNTVGLRRHGLVSQIRMARHQVRTDTFAFLADLATAAHDRLVAHRDRWPVSDDALALLRAKADHSQQRRDLPGPGLRRLRVVGGELWRGNYAKYSYGYKSVLQDVFLR